MRSPVYFTVFLIILFSILFLDAGCFTITMSETPSHTVETSQGSTLLTGDTAATDMKPQINYFILDPENIGARSASTLSWDVSGANQVSIDQGIGIVDPEGSILVYPSQTTIYTLTAVNNAGINIATAKLTVTTISPTTASIPVPYIRLFVANPEVIENGDFSILSWDVINASSVIIDPLVFRQLGSIPFSGSVSVNPLVTTSYLLTAVNSAGTSEKTATVTVNETAATSENKDWSGTWETNWGTMYLTQSSGKVTGTYAHDEGKIVGYISKNMIGNILAGTWSEAPTYSPPNDGGDIQWTMSSDFNSFTGYWRYGSSGDWSGEWTGKRLNSKGVVITP